MPSPVTMGRSRSAPWPGHSPAYRLQPFSLGASVDAVMASEHLQEVSQYDLDTVVARVLRIVMWGLCDVTASAGIFAVGSH